MGRRAAHEPRLFTGPVLLRRTRRDIADLIGAIWLALEMARIVRMRLDRLPHGTA